MSTFGDIAQHFGEIAQILTALAALLTIIFTLRNGKKIHEVHLSLNSRLSQLLKVTAEAAHINGIETERERASKKHTKGD